MRVIPVIDLMNGGSVHAVAGRRSDYKPRVNSQLGCDTLVSEANVYVKKFSFDTAYVADLDAITHGHRNERCWERIADAGLKLWLDAGVSSKSSATIVMRALRRFTVDPVIIVGLESLGVHEYLSELYSSLGPETLAFSLDLRHGKPITQIEKWRDAQPIEIVRSVVAAGIQRFIVLDLADVGVGQGTTTIDLCRAIRGEFSAIELIAGGGVRGIDDLRALADAGCDAALVASALHDGRLTREDIRQVENLPR